MGDKTEDNTTNMYELLVSTFATADALSKAPHRKGHHHAAGVLAKNFRRAGDVSADAQPHKAVKREH